MADISARPTLFFLHSLGASAGAWVETIRRLEAEFTCVALDIPGFGDRAGDDRTDVLTMVDWLIDEVRSCNPAPWMLVGHSMGGKIATLVAARAEAGERGLAAFAGIVLIAASPPAPEPMDDSRREKMMGWFDDGLMSDDEAREFVEANIAGALPESTMSNAIRDLKRCGRHAWRAWLERGSREDWSEAAGRIAAPALVIAGAEDGDLGEANQRRLNVPHFRDCAVEVVPGAAHLIPSERPDVVAEKISRHWAKAAARTLPPAFSRLLASGRVADRVRHTLLRRLDDPPADIRGCLSDAELDVLRAVVSRVLPGRSEGGDLARRIDVTLAEGRGDGWRFADLPPDHEAWSLGLRNLDDLSGGFASLPADRQDEWLSHIAADTATGEADGALSGAQMRLWFEDVRAEIVRAWLSHPASLAHVGYDGFANGGDEDRKQGFMVLAADDAEPWQIRPERLVR